MSVTVRFAPSPTGYLHIGGVRTALYSWLWAKKLGGKFVLRIEDTDVERNSEVSVRIVLDSLRWLGLDWDEGPEVGGDHGPYFQSERESIYREYAERLIASGKAYRCFASKEEIQAAREAFNAQGKKGFKFQSPWRDRNDGDASKPHSVRIKTPRDGAMAWNDLLRGTISVNNTEQQDDILLRPNGKPLYNFGCVIDDLTMGVTLVARGDDHIINTPRQLLIYDALDAKPPQFAHLPMVLGPDGKKLSKRQAAVGVFEYRDMGYLPEAVLNYLARLGWSHGDQEVFTKEELIEKFDWEHVGRSAAQYDKKKFEFVQSEHLHRKDDKELAKLVVPWLEKRSLKVPADDTTLVAAIAPVKLRCTSLSDLAEGLDYFFREEPEFEEKSVKKFLTPDFSIHLEKLIAIVEKEPFNAEQLELATKSWIERDAIKMKNVAQPARVALTGRTRSPGLYETMLLLGKERTLKRLKAGVARATSGS